MRKLLLYTLLLSSCNETDTTLIKSINLKRGALIACSPADKELGTVSFNITGTTASKENFQLALKLLHSFEYDEVEKVCAAIVEKEPGCAMAWWGVAMSNFHALWAPPSGAELEKGAKAVAIARSIKNKDDRESAYIEAIGSFYDNHNKDDHRTRCGRFEKAMEQLYTKYPDDGEAAIFYSLSLVAAADPTDKSYAKQQKAGALLQALETSGRNHPGIVHYIIHAYDYPALALKALPAARRYASVAPASAHALHMPSHIFTRLGLWDECIRSNWGSVNSAQCYAKEAGLKGHWDEELHGLDYLMYGYLQKGDNDSAKKQLEYLKSIREIQPANFKVAYAFAAIPARYVLENKLWAEAAALPLDTANIDWKKFPWQQSINYFARALGAAHTSKDTSAIHELKRCFWQLLDEKDGYKANQVAIQIKTAEAWMTNNLALMQEAAELEDKTEKHPVTPGEVIPARELYADMLLQAKKYKDALQAYEAALVTHPNRFNSLYGALQAAEKKADKEKYARLLSGFIDPQSTRPEIKTIQSLLQ